MKEEDTIKFARKTAKKRAREQQASKSRFWCLFKSGSQATDGNATKPVFSEEGATPSKGPQKL